MKNYIKIKDIVNMAMTEEQGIKLRKEIDKLILDNDKIILDFSGISLFATMFFNASIGYYVMSYSPDECEKIFCLENITPLGKETYKHSFENAKEIYNNRKNIEAIEKITEETIAES